MELSSTFTHAYFSWLVACGIICISFTYFYYTRMDEYDYIHQNPLTLDSEKSSNDRFLNLYGMTSVTSLGMMAIMVWLWSVTYATHLMSWNF